MSQKASASAWNWQWVGGSAVVGIVILIVTWLAHADGFWLAVLVNIGTGFLLAAVLVFLADRFQREIRAENTTVVDQVRVVQERVETVRQEFKTITSKVERLYSDYSDDTTATHCTNLDAFNRVLDWSFDDVGAEVARYNKLADALQKRTQAARTVLAVLLAHGTPVTTGSSQNYCITRAEAINKTKMQDDEFNAAVSELIQNELVHIVEQEEWWNYGVVAAAITTQTPIGGDNDRVWSSLRDYTEVVEPPVKLVRIVRDLRFDLLDDPTN